MEIKRSFNNILVTGGASFIGSHFLDLMVENYKDINFYNYDALTYACNPMNNNKIDSRTNYQFTRGNINNLNFLNDFIEKNEIDCVIHFAAETHVDRSIIEPDLFEKTNVKGTLNILEVLKNTWKDKSDKLLYFISTDEVFGPMAQKKYCNESLRHLPGNPYAASKSGAEAFIRSFKNTYGIPFLISYSSNNFGPRQYPDKLIPMTIFRLINNMEIPVHGNGLNERDWMYVKDHCSAIEKILFYGAINDSYCVGGKNVRTNIEIVHEICDIMDLRLNRIKGSSRKQIVFESDRPGNDNRYAVDVKKIHKELFWQPETSFNEAINQTIDWYLANKNWFHSFT
jgi:dTDP-glucose 4,6-dehydratase